MPQSIPPHQYARRLQRLLMIINEMKTTPHQAPAALYTSLGISRAMFYKDCEVLKALGLAFHYDRQQGRYIITQDRYLPVLDLSISEMLHDLWDACQEHQRLRIVHDRGDGPREWTIDPYQLFFKRRALYLDACVVETRQVHMFRVNRIKSLALLGVRMPTPLVPYNFRERHRHSFSV